MITVVITSSNRFDLLERTLDSFFRVCKYRVERIIINEDSGNAECARRIINKYGGIVHLLYHPHREGLSTALDNLIKNVNTPFVFTCEDDWLFEANPEFMHQSMAIMLNNLDVHQVWIRHKTDHGHPLGNVFQLDGVPVREVLKNYQGHWGGFSFNPTLRRMSDIKHFFPNGFAEFGDEAVCSRHVEKMGYRAVSLEHSAIKHIGNGRHTEGFKV